MILFLSYRLKRLMFNKVARGGVAQLGEHLPCKQGVSGSIPLISTTKALTDAILLVFALITWVHSSAG